MSETRGAPRPSGFREVSKREFRKIYFRRGGGPDSGWTAEYWEKFFEDGARPGWTFRVEDPQSPAHDRMWIVSDNEKKEYRLFFMTDEATEDFFDSPGKE